MVSQKEKVNCYIHKVIYDNIVIAVMTPKTSKQIALEFQIVKYIIV